MDTSICAALNSDLSENVAYNNPAFPVYIKNGRLSSYPNFSAVSHWHDDIEFILIREGMMTYDVNGNTIPLHQGEGIFVNSRCFHYGHSETRSECHFLCVLLSPKLFAENDSLTKEFLNPLLENDKFPYEKLNPSLTWQNQILHDLETLFEENKEKINPFIVIEKSAHIFRLLSENMNSFFNSDVDSQDILTLTRMIGYVQKNYALRILIKDIAKAGNCCKTKCTELFQKYLNTSTMVYLNRYRLEKSAFLLQNTDRSIIDIAYSCGFSNSSYFCELFRKYYDMTPGNFRKR